MNVTRFDTIRDDGWFYVLTTPGRATEPSDYDRVVDLAESVSVRLCVSFRAWQWVSIDTGWLGGLDASAVPTDFGWVDELDQPAVQASARVARAGGEGLTETLGGGVHGLKRSQPSGLTTPPSSRAHERSARARTT